MRFYARPAWLISGAVALLLLVAAIASDYTWKASVPVPISHGWSIVLELKSMGTPFAEYYRRVHRVSNHGQAASTEARVELTPNAGPQGRLCVYRITTPAGGVLVEFTDRFDQVVVDLESFARVETVPPFSARQLVGEFLDDSPLTFVVATPNNRCFRERAA